MTWRWALLALVRDSWSGDLLISGDPAEVIARVRIAAWNIAGPLLGILGGGVVASFLAHQAQVGGLFAPALLAPDPSRLWTLRLDEEGSGSGFSARLGRGAWSVIKAAVVIGVAAWVIRSDLDGLHRLAQLDPPALARASGAMIRSMAFSLALADAGARAGRFRPPASAVRGDDAAHPRPAPRGPPRRRRRPRAPISPPQAGAGPPGRTPPNSSPARAWPWLALRA